MSRRHLGLWLLAAAGLTSAACEIVYGLDGYARTGAETDGGSDATLDSRSPADGPTSPADAGDASPLDSAADAACESCPSAFVLATAPNGRELADDDAALYWLSVPGDYGSLMRTDKVDGGTSILVADAGENPSGVAVDDTRVYWTTRVGSDAISGAGTVLSVGKDGKGLVLLASGAAWRPTTLAVDTSSVYVENPYANLDALVSKVSKDGGARTTVVAASGPSEEREGIVVDDSYVYYLHLSNIFRLPKGCPDASACMPTRLMFENSSPYYVDSFTIDDAAVYWTMRYGAPNTGIIHPCGVYAVAKGSDAANGSDGEVALIPHCGSGTAADDTSVYAFDRTTLALLAVPKAGGSTTTLTPTQAGPNPPMVADGTAIYWIDDGTGVIMKLPR